MKKHSFTEKVSKFLNGKGFYIALVLCVAAIGVSGWYIWQSFVTAGELAAETSQVETVTVTPEDTEEVMKPEEAEEDTSQEEEPEEPQAEEEVAEPEAETMEPVELPIEPAEETAAPSELEWVVPLEGEVATAFSADTLTYNSALKDWRTHNGIDLSAPEGTEVLAAHAGTVVAVENDPVLGKSVKIDCGDGLNAIYGNLAEETAVSLGDKVEAGAVIGAVGETAAGEANEEAWLHFALEQDGEPIDPAGYLE
jgi:murein DD-endopeptidase MepM/ murein hydrolase activator NlpD